MCLTDRWTDGAQTDKSMAAELQRGINVIITVVLSQRHYTVRLKNVLLVVTVLILRWQHKQPIVLYRNIFSPRWKMVSDEFIHTNHVIVLP